MGTCMGKSRTESKEAQTDLNPIFGYANGEHNDSPYNNYKQSAVCPRNQKNQRSKLENLQLKNLLLNEVRHQDKYDFNFHKRDSQFSDCINASTFEMGKPKLDYTKTNGHSTSTISGVWPINGKGDSNSNNLRNKRNILSQSRLNINEEVEKSNLNLNMSDEEDIGIEKNNFYNENNNIDDYKYNLYLQAHAKNEGTVKFNRKNGALRQSINKEPRRKRSLKNNNYYKPKLGNNNSNNYNLLLEDKRGANQNNRIETFHSTNLLDQDNYAIQYTFYIDDNDICTKPFYDRRMVAIAKTCRCRIYFHAKADDSEKPLYYKGKPVRPVTITSPDMACLKRCLGSIDSQFPYFNCKAFLSLSS